ncbi:MAG: hypothetical protein HFI86_00410 [Bacilli bacterium]|nr:hypothetical protein [Bacilli bacterium]
MARGSQFVVDLSVIETECENFKNCSGKYQNNTHSYFKNSYLTKCTDSQIRRAVSKISSYYENVKKDYDEIYKWWKSYIDNVNGLENYLSNQGLSTLSEQSLINYLKCSLEELESYNFDIQIAYGSFNKQMGVYNSETDKIDKLNNNTTSNYKNSINGKIDPQFLNKNKNTTKQGSSFNSGNFAFDGIGTNYGKGNSSLNIEEVTFNDIFGSGEQNNSIKNGSSGIASFDIGSKIESFFDSIEVLSDNAFNKNKKYSMSKSSIGFGATATAFGLGMMGSRRSKKKTSSETSRYSQGNYKGSATDTNNSSNKSSYANNNSFKNQDSYVNLMNTQNIEIGNTNFNFKNIVDISKKIIGLIKSIATNSIIICNTNGVNYQTSKSDVKATGAKIGEANSINLINKTEYLKTNTARGYRTFGTGIFSQTKKIVKNDNIKYHQLAEDNVLSSDAIRTKLKEKMKVQDVPRTNPNVLKAGKTIKLAKDVAEIKSKEISDLLFNDLNVLLSKFSNKDFLEKNKHLEASETFDWIEASSELKKDYESDLGLYNVVIDNQYNYYSNLTTLSETIAFKSLANLTPQEQEEFLKALDESITLLNANKNKTANEKTLIKNLKNLSSTITNNQFTEVDSDSVRTLLLSSLLEEKTLTSQLIYQYEIARDQLKYSYIEKMGDFDEVSNFSNLYDQCQFDANGNVIKKATMSYNDIERTITINGITYTDYIDYNDPNTIIDETGYVVKADHAYAMVDKLTLSYLMAKGLLEIPEEEYFIFPQEYFARNVSLMTEDEVKKYHYLYEKYGEYRAEDYFRTLQDSLNQRKGFQAAIEYFNSLEGKTYAEKLVNFHLTGIEAGMLNWAEGIDDVLFADGIISANQYKQMWLLQTLSGNVDIESFADTDFADTAKDIVKHLTEQYESTGKSLGYSYQIGNTVGNMLPSVIISATISPLFATEATVVGGIDTTTKVGKVISKIPQMVSSTSIGLSTFGNTKNQALHDGYDIKSANTQAFLSSIAEGGLEFALGNIPGISKESSNTILGFIKEGGEECLQEFVGMCISMSNGEYINFDQFTETEIQTFVMSAIVSAEMNVANATISFAGNTVVLSADKINQICSEKGVAGVEAYIRDQIVTSGATDLTDTNVTKTDATNVLSEDINTIKNNKDGQIGVLTDKDASKYLGLKNKVELTEINERIGQNINNTNLNEQYNQNLNKYRELQNLKEQLEIKLSDKYAETKYNVNDLKTQLDNINQLLVNDVMKIRDNIFQRNFSISYEYACRSSLEPTLSFIMNNKNELSNFFTETEFTYIKQMYDLTYINPYNTSFQYQEKHSKLNFHDINEFYLKEMQQQTSIDESLYKNSTLSRQEILDLIIKMQTAEISLRNYQQNSIEFNMKKIRGEKGFYIEPNYNDYLDSLTKYKELQKNNEYRKTINDDIEKFNYTNDNTDSDLMDYNTTVLPINEVDFKAVDSNKSFNNIDENMETNNNFSNELDNSIKNLNLDKTWDMITISALDNIVNNPEIVDKFLNFDNNLDYFGTNFSKKQYFETFEHFKKEIDNGNYTLNDAAYKNLTKLLEPNLKQQITFNNIDIDTFNLPFELLESIVEVDEIRNKFLDYDNNIDYFGGFSKQQYLNWFKDIELAIVDDQLIVSNNFKRNLNIILSEELKSIYPDFTHTFSALSKLDDIFSNFSDYGPNQGIIRKMLKKPQNYKNRFLLIGDSMRKILPGISNKQIYKFLSKLDASTEAGGSGGICSYAATTGSIIKHFFYNQSDFKNAFGVDLIYEVTDDNGYTHSEFSQDLVISELYAYINKGNWDTFDLHPERKIGPDLKRKINGDWIYKYNSGIDNKSILGVDQTIVKFYKKIRMSKSLECIPVTSYLKSKNLNLGLEMKSIYNSYNMSIDYANMSNQEKLSYLINEIKKSLDNEKYLTIGVNTNESTPLCLYSDKQCNSCIEQIDGHIMTVTGITYSESDHSPIIKVSTWAGVAYLKLIDFMNNGEGTITEFNIHNIENNKLINFYVENEVKLDELIEMQLQLLFNQSITIDDAAKLLQKYRMKHYPFRALVKKVKLKSILKNMILIKQKFQSAKEGIIKNINLKKQQNRLDELDQIRNSDDYKNNKIDKLTIDKEYYKLKNIVDNKTTDETVFLINELSRLLDQQQINPNDAKLNAKIQKLKETNTRIYSKKKQIIDITGQSIHDLSSEKITEVDIPTKILEQAKSRAIEIFKNAQQLEKQITNDMQLLESEVSSLIGEEYKLKDQDRLTRKIISDASKDTKKDIKDLSFSDIDKAAFEIGDGLRYTLLIEEDAYKETVKSSLDELTKKGYRVVKFKNSWTKPHYKGINVSIQAPSGLLFELQFHTPYSFKTKETLTHEFYEINRNFSNTERVRDIANEIQIDYQSLVDIPEDIIGYNWLNEYNAKVGEIEILDEID